MVVHRLPLWQRLLCTTVPVLAILPLIAQAWTDGGWSLAWAVLGAVAMVTFLVRSWQRRVVTGPAVVVVNWFRTHRLDWREVKRSPLRAVGWRWSW